ncbi:hypothetical protein AB0758_48065 [Tolypothrix bouteillei VB521301_2]|uniref:hypothetical protein n=1 Tax=Tolypothrix bouteillei TaxID=1246981 RepID=UPI0038B50320
METLPLKIDDETLRDGEQQAGIFFSLPAKQKLAHDCSKREFMVLPLCRRCMRTRRKS